MNVFSMYQKVLIHVTGCIFFVLLPYVAHGDFGLVTIDSESRSTRDNDSGLTIVDPDSRLIWQKTESRRIQWREAMKYCKNLKLGGVRHWRLPNREELQSLYTIRNRFPDGYSSDYWSSVTHDENRKYAWRTRFKKGKLFPGYKSNHYLARCVIDMSVADRLYRAAVTAMENNEYRSVKENLIKYIQLATADHPNFSAAKKLGYRLRWEFDPVTGMEFALVKGGCFQMGDTFIEGDSDEKPVHEVCVDDFYLAKYEVTQGQWRKIMKNNPSRFKNGSNYPVEQVSWNDVQDFIEKLNRRSKVPSLLPTEAEWEYACREEGKEIRFCNGEDMIDPKKANFDGRSEYEEIYSRVGVYRRETTPVGSFSPNSLGLYDMSGNVWEWVSDRYGETYYKRSPKNNPKGPRSGIYRVFRGGSWYGYSVNVRSADRVWYEPDARGDFLGFRLIRRP